MLSDERSVWRAECLLSGVCAEWVRARCCTRCARTELWQSSILEGVRTSTEDIARRAAEALQSATEVKVMVWAILAESPAHTTSATPHSTLHAPRSTLHTYIQHSTLHNSRSALHNSQHTTHTSQFPLCSPSDFSTPSHNPRSTVNRPDSPRSAAHTQYASASAYSSQPTLHSTQHTLHSHSRTPHSTLHTPHSTLHTPHSTLHTPRPTPLLSTLRFASTPCTPLILQRWWDGHSKQWRDRHIVACSR